MTENFQEMTEDILAHPLFLQLRSCPHHGGEKALAGVAHTQGPMAENLDLDGSVGTDVLDLRGAQLP